MAYRIDVNTSRPAMVGERETTIVLVGCGGSGSFLAESVCRLLIGRATDLYLVDMDRVEEHNIGRQAFGPEDRGRFKAQALAERLARRFDRTVGYSIQPFDRTLHSEVFGRPSGRLRLLLGCVDNSAARRAIATTLDGRSDVLWLDCGNGRNSGQVLLGNATRPDMLRGTFLPKEGVCRALPAPSLQRPDLLDAPPAPQLALDCSQAIATAEQCGTINQIIAAIAAGFVEKLLAGSCTWMASYFDVDDGTLRCVPAEPKTVADIVGVHVNAVTRQT